MTENKILKCILIIVIGIYSLGVTAGPILATKQQIAQFKNTKTCVVMEGGINFYNAPVKDAVEKYWKLTEYLIIDQSEFNKKKTDPHYSFIVLVQGSFDKDPGGVSYSYITLVLGDPSGNMTKMPEFCSIPLAYSGDNDTDYEYVIPSVIKFMQLHVKNLEKDRLPISLNGLKYYNRTGLKDKVILLKRDRMAADADTPEKISAAYPYGFKLLNPEEFQEQLSSPNSIFNFHVGPLEGMGAGKCFEMLFDNDGNLYYFNSRKITNANADGFNLNDFKQIK